MLCDFMVEPRVLKQNIKHTYVRVHLCVEALYKYIHTYVTGFEKYTSKFTSLLYVVNQIGKVSTQVQSIYKLKTRCIHKTPFHKSAHMLKTHPIVKCTYYHMPPL